jgi:polyisoprenoid-binding protein YceI
MTRFGLLLVLGLAIGVAGSANAQKLGVPTSGTQTITLNDKVGHNQFTWVSEAPMENIKGSSEGVTGTLTIDPQDLSKLRGTVRTASATMKTGNATRDRHLLSSEWIDAARYPQIAFTITGMKDVKTSGAVATGNATGNFSLHGVTKAMTVPFKLTYVPENDKTRMRAPGDLMMVNADFTISLKDFNIAGTEGQIGSKVGETIKISAQLFGNAQHGATSMAN